MNNTIYQLFSETCRKHSGKTALRFKDNSGYAGLTFKEMKDTVDAVAENLRKAGISKGDSVGIFSYNRRGWAVADMAILKLGAVVVPIYHTLPADYVSHIINDANVKLLFVENKLLLSVVESIRDKIPCLKNIALFNDAGITGKERFLRFNDMTKTGEMRETDDAIVSAGDIVSARDAVSDVNVATIVYTSGATGIPKGVVLTHGNITSNVLAITKRYNANSDDVIVSYLPMSHMFERTCGYYTTLLAGGCVAFSEELFTVDKTIEAIRPTLLLAVPRFIEKVYERVVKQTEEGSFLKKLLVSSAIRNINAIADLKEKRAPVPPVLALKYNILKKIVYSGFKKSGWGNLRLIVCGSAPLNKDIGKFFSALGFNIVDGYGLTETSPGVCSTIPGENSPGTVGKPFDGVEVTIGKDDEVLVRGPNVMKRYLNMPAETVDAIDSNGWFHTGDQGRLDGNGNLVLTGRIKELIVTSYGKNIAPVPVETAMSSGRYVSQVIVCGDKRKYLTALVVPEKSYIEDYAVKNKVQYESYAKLLDKNEIKNLIKDEIEKSAADRPSYEKVKAFVLIENPFTVENGLLTPTFKPRRKEIVARYAGLIDRLYESDRKDSK